MPVSNSLSEPTVPARLPELEAGITLLAAGPTVERVIHALAVDHVLRSGGTAVWVDPGTHAQTAPLVELAPSDRILDRVRVARGFTAFQHLELLDSLPDLLGRETELVVVPEIDRQYRDGSLLGDEGRDMLLSAIAALATVAREHDLSVLLTRTAADELGEPIETAGDRLLECEVTRFGPRFRTGNDETLVYPVDGGRWVQTTLAFWTEILAAREPLYETEIEGSDPELGVSARGAN